MFKNSPNFLHARNLDDFLACLFINGFALKSFRFLSRRKFKKLMENYGAKVTDLTFPRKSKIFWTPKT